MPPLIRARWRERLGLPAALVVAIGPDVDPAAEDRRVLSYAAAAVVTGPMLETALTLGTPLVTTAADADRLGLRAGQHVEVADTELGVRAVARSPRQSPPTTNGRPGSLREARQFAERTLGLVRTNPAPREPLALVSTSGWTSWSLLPMHPSGPARAAATAGLVESGLDSRRNSGAIARLSRRVRGWVRRRAQKRC